MGTPAGVGITSGVTVSDCVWDDHLLEVDGVIQPQPWMQWRQVRSIAAPSKSGSYPVTMTAGGLGSVNVFGTISSLFGSLLSSLPSVFGLAGLFMLTNPTASAAGNKNDLLHSLQQSWTNNSPVPQWVYGTITRGGCRVTLQARSRGGLTLYSGYRKHVSDPGPLVAASMVGCGADMGRGGTLAIGTTYGMIEERMNSVTIPLAPERAGWVRLEPGESITAKAELRFMSEFWENTTIDKGDTDSESSYDSGGTRLDLYAVPVI